MTLRDINLKLSYNSRENNVVEEFYIPCFQNAIKYERAVGFFTSEILIEVSYGLHKFLSNKGHMRLICSPKLSEEDIEAMKSGYANREAAIYNALMREIDRIPAEIVDDSVNFLSWLISKNRLDIKIALPEHLEWDRYGIYHEKIGLFYDGNDDVIVFSGSNELPAIEVDLILSEHNVSWGIEGTVHKAPPQ